MKQVFQYIAVIPVIVVLGVLLLICSLLNQEDQTLPFGFGEFMDELSELTDVPPWKLEEYFDEDQIWDAFISGESPLSLANSLKDQGKSLRADLEGELS